MSKIYIYIDFQKKLTSEIPDVNFADFQAKKNL